MSCIVSSTPLQISVLCIFIQKKESILYSYISQIAQKATVKQKLKATVIKISFSIHFL